MTLHDLIDRIERASGRNLSIDGDVVEHLGLQPPGMRRAGGSQPELFTDGAPGLHARTWLAPKLTDSVDEVEKIVPKRWRLESLSDKHGTRRCRAILRTTDHKATVIGYGATRALAFLAGAMRAKAHERDDRAPDSQEIVDHKEP